ncbi:cytidylyltransferase domain-containing protein [Rufibacter sediminis]|uniref:Acylneuraminate cytidylyltransferase family protein n=1 Tax=Rufibacter sediminis TaxID=2762756 RepID=A0ABR6VNM4_9BACT|nr:acylneuraminate cytidylyltransferase family protein [Rufibacter sediminis]MBC3538507.1 acylneuraminate cytidylyltransferase family protein [Rufibacter sediminis]
MKILAIIPARSGSKGVKDKNIYPINGKPLLTYAIETAKQCPEVTDIFISTDSPVYEAIAKEAGARSLGLRPSTLSSDIAKTADVLIDLITSLQHRGYNYDLVLLLQPTSPVRKPSDITNMLQILHTNQNASGVVSVSRLIEPHPYKLKIISPEGYLLSFLDNTSSELPRQLLPPIYKLNGAVYIVKVEYLLSTGNLINSNTLPYEMEEGVNIDSIDDIELLTYFLQTHKIRL